jgi:hypothetical protein
VKDHCNENHNTLKKETEEDTRRCKESSWSWIGRLMKMANAKVIPVETILGMEGGEDKGE